MFKKRIFLSFVLPLAIAACSSLNGPDAQAANEFDLSLYSFHANTQSIGGEISYVENYYDKASGSAPIYSPSIMFKNTGLGIDKVATGLEGPSAQYRVLTDTIEENNPSFNDSRTFDRFARLGDSYIDSVYEQIGVAETCALQRHLNSFDLSTATSPIIIANGVYEDVIQVYCDSSFITDGASSPNYSWDRYYAKGVGLIFIDGDWVNLLGEIYAIPEYLVIE